MRAACSGALGDDRQCSLEDITADKYRAQRVRQQLIGRLVYRWCQVLHGAGHRWHEQMRPIAVVG
jgi:hypothetical protein